MPVMNKMRDSMPVVFAVLAGIFLLMIIFEWGGQGAIFSGRGDAETMGLVNGYKISQKDYNKILESVTAQMKEQGKKQVLSDAEEDQAADKAWDEAVTQAVINQSIEKMGITVTDQDVRDQIFENPPPQVRQQFTDSMGMYHEDAYIHALRDPRNDSLVRQMEAGTRDQLTRYKWQAAMLSTIRVTDEEAHVRYYQDSAKAMVEVVKLLPQPVTPAMEKQVTDKEIQDYYDAHSWKYKQDEQRKYKIVMFPRNPTARDTAIALESANSIKARLTEASGAEADSVARDMAPDYSDMPYQPKHLITMRDIGGDTSLMNAKPGDVAIVTASNKLTVVRIVNVVDTGREEYHVRHIVIGGMSNSMPRGPQVMNQDSVRAAAEQVVSQAKAGANFAQLVRAHSTDTRTAGNGGDIGWVDAGMFPPNIFSGIKDLPAGGIAGPFDMPGGSEIIQVVQRSRRAWEVVAVPIDIKAGHQTVLMQQQMANVFHDQAVKTGFDVAAKAADYKVMADAPPATQKGRPVFGSRELVDWLFQASKGDISQPFKLSAQQYLLVAQLTDIAPAGPKPLDEVKPQIVQELAKRKAVASLAPRAQQLRAMLQPGADLSQVVTATGDSTLKPITVKIGPAESVSGIPTAEYVVNNWAYDQAKPGDISQPLKGQNGYYIVKLLSRDVPSDKAFETAKPMFQKALFEEKEQRFLNQWIENQKDKATIVDYRVKH
jgi:peptidyl-prolyl cis-trans isomerase D